MIPLIAFNNASIKKNQIIENEYANTIRQQDLPPLCIQAPKAKLITDLTLPPITPTKSPKTITKSLTEEILSQARQSRGSTRGGGEEVPRSSSHINH